MEENYITRTIDLVEEETSINGDEITQGNSTKDEFDCNKANQSTDETLEVQNRYSNNLNENFTYLPNYTNNYSDTLRIGDSAPEFSGKTTFGDCSLSDFRGKWLVFFCHPGDFTPVCTTEFMCFAKYYNRFKEKNCELLGLSLDNINSHLAWIHSIYKNTGIQIPFPIISDKDARIANLYNMMSTTNPSNMTIRSVYIICPNGFIRAILNYPVAIGRNIGEILRIVEALQKSDSENVATPANWMPKMPTLAFPPSTYPELMERLRDNQNFTCADWYLCFNNDSVDPINAGKYYCNDINTGDEINYDSYQVNPLNPLEN